LLTALKFDVLTQWSGVQSVGP